MFLVHYTEYRMSVCLLTPNEKVPCEGSAGSCHTQSPAGSSGAWRINCSVTKTTDKQLPCQTYLTGPWLYFQSNKRFLQVSWHSPIKQDRKYNNLCCFITEKSSISPPPLKTIFSFLTCIHFADASQTNTLSLKHALKFSRVYSW